jgi:protoporphyrin/coproporphyrin ferrochelatase
MRPNSQTISTTPQSALASKVAILFCNLGTPDAPDARSVRRFLGEFLHDRRVVEIPRVIWCPILHGIILRTRPAKTAAKYKSIWTPEGSPLRVWTMRQASLMQMALTVGGNQVEVAVAMRYGTDSIPDKLSALSLAGVRRVLVLTAYPQYSATTTASIADAVHAWSRTTRSPPEFRFVNGFSDDPGYISALASSVRDHWQTHGRARKLVMSFHGIPQRNVDLGDPYATQARQTAHALAASLDLNEDAWLLTFQSRLGRAKWLQPYTEPSLIQLAKSGVGSVDIICPGFNCDGLETLEEINQEVRAAYLGAGGTRFNYIPCLNDRPDWINALTAVAKRHLQGWDTDSQLG